MDDEFDIPEVPEPELPEEPEAPEAPEADQAAPDAGGSYQEDVERAESAMGEAIANDWRLESLQQQIDDQARQIAEMRELIERQGQDTADKIESLGDQEPGPENQADQSELFNPHPFVFPAALNDDDDYQEVVVGNDGLTTFYPDGRVFNDSLLANDTLDSSFYMELPGTSGSDPVIWKLPVGGGGGGPFGNVEVVKIDSNRTGGGKYKGYLAETPSTGTLSYTGDVAAGDIGTTGSVVEITVVNANEQGQSTHALTAGTPICEFWIAVRLPYNDEDDFPCYLINGIDTTPDCDEEEE